MSYHKPPTYRTQTQHRSTLGTALVAFAAAAIIIGVLAVALGHMANQTLDRFEPITSSSTSR